MSHSQYAATSLVPLIKSPSLRVPKRVDMPVDIHPLPDDITPYFAYPFILEPQVLIVEITRRVNLASDAARREAYLKAREAEDERRVKEQLRRIAPGFEPGAEILSPITKAAPPSSKDELHEGRKAQESLVMDDLVEQLAKMESENRTILS